MFVLRRREPCGQGAPRVTVVFHRFHRTEDLGRHRALVDEVFGRNCLGVVVDALFAGLHARLAPQAGEETDKPVVVIHRPAIERVIVTLGALNLDAEKHLREVRSESLWIQAWSVHQHRVKIHRTVLQIAPRGDDHVAYHFVQWTSYTNLAPNPFLKGIRSLHVRANRRVVPTDDAQLLAPECGPVIGEGLVTQQLVDFPATLAWMRVTHERVVFLRRWWSCCKIQRDAT